MVPQEKATVECCLCDDTEEVTDDYPGHRSHVYKKHKSSIVDQDSLADVLKECFPNATILNDAMVIIWTCYTDFIPEFMHPFSAISRDVVRPSRSPRDVKFN